ncbi:cleavage stimulation factor subunit 1-like isoform X2 [Ostrea edulis]|uniref:cleavage stimulation factor subunit 1-like isoform X2 n=1 Tax=Ostrea edulis TaxID=37623 RepID=UPI0024AFD367|nr:cleavage stimulation factor subunit 1-like isoform X2 [Ostrea edulis]
MIGGASHGDSEVKNRELMYRLMISQLFYDGHQQLAVQLSNIAKAHPACPPSDRLFKVVKLGLDAEEELSGRKRIGEQNIAPGTGIDLEYETDVQSISPEGALYETCYVTAHKGPCRAGAFHSSGKLIATGSEDASIKEVTCLDFHPSHSILASGSTDFSVRFFEYSKPSVKKAYKSIQESVPVRCLSFHPSGDFLLVGVDHPTVRLYDVNTFQCFVGRNPSTHHTLPVSAAKWSPNANLYATGSVDGDIKVWDGVSNLVISTFKKAHDGEEVCSVTFSRNSKYILSSGKDSLVKLWELSTNRCLIVYTGAGMTGKMDQGSQAVFNHTEDYIFFPDENTTSLCCWDSRNAERQRLLALGHNGAVRYIGHSPTGPSFITCSEDFRARFWYRKADTD